MVAMPNSLLPKKRHKEKTAEWLRDAQGKLRSAGAGARAPAPALRSRQPVAAR